MISFRALAPLLALLLVAALGACHKAHDVGALIISGDGDGDGGDGDGDSVTNNPDDFGDGDSGDGDGDSGDGDGSGGGNSGTCEVSIGPPADCNLDACAEPNFILVSFLGSEKCCTSDGLCGADLMGVCSEYDAPGELDSACPDSDQMGQTLAGCCRADGTCGNDLGMIDLGCALASEQAFMNPICCGN